MGKNIPNSILEIFKQKRLVDPDRSFSLIENESYKDYSNQMDTFDMDIKSLNKEFARRIKEAERLLRKHHYL